MAPGDVAHVPRTPSPVAEAGLVAEHFRSRARLRRLLVRLRRPTPSTPALRATPGGASLTTFGFVTIVPRYLLVQVMPSHSFAALTALIVRRVNGFADRPMPACTGRPHAPRRGIGVRTRQRHLAAARAKKNLKLCAKQLEVKKFPAPCYSPIVNYTVPSPLEPLTTVFGKGTCVSAPLSAPEKITIKKTSPGIISKIQSSRLSNIC